MRHQDRQCIKNGQNRGRLQAHGVDQEAKHRVSFGTSLNP
jgi:hypothetical protein